MIQWWQIPIPPWPGVRYLVEQLQFVGRDLSQIAQNMRLLLGRQQSVERAIRSLQETVADQHELTRKEFRELREVLLKPRLTIRLGEPEDQEE